MTKWSRLLLSWYDANRRALPWRTESPRDPYKVWVSEIMLQQTRVEAVKSYYQNWMEHFPDIPSLAAADEEQVVRQWQGLGYYNRARNLRLAAREIMASYGGRMPDTPEAVRALKGIGEYTAGAILSMAFGRRETAVDGNVLRVLARLYNLDGNILSSAVKKEIGALAAACQDPHRPGDFNEALMDLGATVCIPGKPRCGDCPLQTCCGARAAGREAELPVRQRKKTALTEKMIVYVVWAEDGALPLSGVATGGLDKKDGSEPCFLLHRRPAEGLLANMWEFPCAAGPYGKRKLEASLSDLGVTVRSAAKPAMQIRHVFSHRIWGMAIYRTEGLTAEMLPAAAAKDGLAVTHTSAAPGEKDVPAVKAMPAAPLAQEGLAAEWSWVPLARLSGCLLAGPHNKIFTDFILTQNYHI